MKDHGRSHELLSSRLKHLVAGLFGLDLPEPNEIADLEPLVGRAMSTTGKGAFGEKPASP